MNCLLACAENKNEGGRTNTEKSNANNMEGRNKENSKNDKNQCIILAKIDIGLKLPSVAVTGLCIDRDRDRYMKTISKRIHSQLHGS